MNRWLDRPGYVVVVAFLAGAAVAAVVAVVIFVRRGDGDGERVVATATVPVETPGGTAPATAAGTPGTPVAATATPGRFDNPDDALAAFVRDQLRAQYIGGCPLGAPGAEQPQGICSLELYRSDELVTFIVGPPFSEGIGEVVLTREEGGLWTLTFLEPPRLDLQIAVGAQVVVFGAGDCLRFRETPGPAGKQVSCQIDGTRGRVAEGPVEMEGVVWWRVEGLGWASAQYLAPVP